MGVSLRCASGRRAAGCAIASVLRTADAPSACLTQQPLDVLLGFGTYLCFTLFDTHYHTLTRLEFFTLFQLRLFYLLSY
ncbi:MAG: hypothetical protein RML94_11115 [Bacteroidia bacterium]|nr:hypothetical protein [Bacteroidia bacterium]